MRNFDTIPIAMRTVDGEILSEISIHDFEKNRKIETRVLRYGRITSPDHVPRSTKTESLIETPLQLILKNHCQ